jgi:hypothetical protein
VLKALFTQSRITATLPTDPAQWTNQVTWTLANHRPPVDVVDIQILTSVKGPPRTALAVPQPQQPHPLAQRPMDLGNLVGLPALVGYHRHKHIRRRIISLIQRLPIPAGIAIPTGIAATSIKVSTLGSPDLTTSNPYISIDRRRRPTTAYPIVVAVLPRSRLILIVGCLPMSPHPAIQSVLEVPQLDEHPFLENHRSTDPTHPATLQTH